MKSLLSIAAPAVLVSLAPQEPTGPAPASAGEPRSLIAVVPEDAVFFASASDLAGLRAAAETNSWSRMLSGEEFAPLWDEVWAQMQAEMAEDDDPSAEELRLLWDSLQGALVVFGNDLEDSIFGLAFDPGAGRASFEDFLARVDEADDSAVSYEEYAGVSLEIAEPGEDEDPFAEFEVDGVWCWVGAATRDQALEQAHAMIDRLRGSREACIEDSALLGAARQGSSPGRIEFFVDVGRILAEVPPTEEALDEETRRILDLIGLTRLSWAHGTMDLGAGEDLDLHLRMAWPAEGYLADWLGALGPLPRSLAALGPANATEASFFNLDFFALYESIWDLVADLDPQAHDQGREALESGQQAMGGLDLEGDFLAQLTGEVVTFKVPVPEEELAAFDQVMEPLGVEAEDLPEELRVGSVFVIGLEDAAAVELFLEDALNAVGGMFGLSYAASVESEEYQGFQVQSLELPVGYAIHWCFTDDYVVGSAFPSALRSVLALHGKEDAPNLLANEHFGPHIAQHAQASMLGLAPSASWVRMLLEAFQMGLDMVPQATWDNTEGGAETDWPFAGLQLPEASTADRYLDGTLIVKLERSADALELALMTR